MVYRHLAMRAPSTRGMIGMFALALGSGALGAQESKDSTPPFALPGSHTHLFRSQITGRPYRLIVALPSGYADHPSVRYPVLYMIDGQISALVGTPTYRVSHAPNDSLILVGVSYPGGDQDHAYRRVDYAAPVARDADSATRRMAGEGKCCGAATTARVFREEIMPLIDRAYRVTDDRGIFGHSLGGIFAAYALFAEPDLFSRYAITTASPWTDNASIFEIEATYARTHTALPKKVVITVGSDEFLYNRYTADRLTATLKARQYEGLDLTSIVLQGSQHNSMVEYSYALRMLYPPRSWTETSGAAAVKDSARHTLDTFLDAFQRGDAAAMRGTLVGDTAFAAIASGFVVTDVDAYVAKVTARRRGAAHVHIDTLYAASDAPNDAIFIAPYTNPAAAITSVRQGVLTFEVVRRPNGWRVAYVQDAPASWPKPLTVVRVETGGGKPVRGASVSLNSAAGRVVAGQTDRDGVVRLSFDWHTNWITPGYMYVTALGYQPAYAPPPNRDSVTVVLKP